MKYICRYASPLGMMLIAADDEGISGVWFEGQKNFPKELSSESEEVHPVLKKAVQWLDEYFSGNSADMLLPLHFVGSDFEISVWKLLLEIPYGKTTTYGDIARRISEGPRGLKMSAQAVGGAVGRNKLSVIVPCHRVLGKGGNLTGYAGGIDRKAALLTLEGVKDFTYEKGILK